MSRITVVNPNTSDVLTAVITAAATQVAPHGVEVVGVHPTSGVPSVESHAEETIAAVGVLEQVRVNDAATDAFVIACFGDTGVPAAREIATGPVVGMTEAALQAACLVAHRFTVITMPARTIAHSDRVVRALGLQHRCTVRAVDVAVHDLEAGAVAVLDAFAAEGALAMAEDGAEAIVLGCAGLADLVDPLAERLRIPVVEGVAAAVGAASSLLTMHLETSRRTTFAPVTGLPVTTLHIEETS